MLTEIIVDVPGTQAATARMVFSGMANAHDIGGPARFAAIDSKRELAVYPLRMERVSAGKTLIDVGPDSRILTPELTKSLGSFLSGLDIRALWKSAENSARECI